MRNPSLVGAAAWAIAVWLSAGVGAERSDTPAWNAKAAASYLDSELDWWSTWPNAARDRGTFCVSCHTVAPYVMARPALAATLEETELTAPARKLFDNVATRVRLWNEVAPFYPDQRVGLPKTSESRGTESVLNALVLSTRDSHARTLSAETKQAFDHMWALQMRTGPLDGAWAWLNFHLEPWESDGAPYFGAAMAAAAISRAPQGYAASPDAKPGLERLRTYVSSNFDTHNLFNQLTMIVASRPLEGFVTAAQRQRTAEAVAQLQEADGGWSLSRFGTFARVDKTPLEAVSDGYATALAVLVLQQDGGPRLQAETTRGLAWLRSHQEATGRWVATSLNKRRDPTSDPARFMNDAATAYAVLALTAR
jgi:squalene-hopene/tetraprenyl-beta-curcumene cyclase